MCRTLPPGGGQAAKRSEAVTMLGKRDRGALLSCSVLAVTLALLAPTSAPPTAAAPGSCVRAGRAGALSHFDLARKDCLGTARNTKSKVWYTVAGGVLSDVYSPTIDNTNVETLQYVVTDGGDVHRPADPRHDVHGEVDRRQRDGLPRHQHREERQVPAGHRLRHRPDRDAVVVSTRLEPAKGRRTSRCTSGTTRRSTATAGAGRATVAGTTPWSMPPPRPSSAPTPTPRRTPPTVTTPCRCTARCGPTARS